METKEYYGGTYPDPPEIKDKHIKVKVHLSFTIEEDVPEDWDEEKIKKDIDENLNYFNWYDEEIEEIEVS